MKIIRTRTEANGDIRLGSQTIQQDADLFDFNQHISRLINCGADLVKVSDTEYLQRNHSNEVEAIIELV